MEQLDPETALSAAEAERANRRDRAVGALEWFREREGLVPRGEAVEAIADENGWSESQANQAVGDVVGDLVDPVQQVVHPERGKLVGIIEYRESPDSGAYAYTAYDDVDGRRNRAVCSQCVVEANSDTEVSHATEGEGTTPPDATWDELYSIIRDHYSTAHDVEPSEVAVGASLASGTTISGSTAFHAGNDGIGSGLDADSLEGNEPGDISSVTPKIDRDGNAKIKATETYTFSTVLGGVNTRTGANTQGFGGPGTVTGSITNVTNAAPTTVEATMFGNFGAFTNQFGSLKVVADGPNTQVSTVSDVSFPNEDQTKTTVTLTINNPQGSTYDFNFTYYYVSRAQPSRFGVAGFVNGTNATRQNVGRNISPVWASWTPLSPTSLPASVEDRFNAANVDTTVSNYLLSGVNAGEGVGFDFVLDQASVSKVTQRLQLYEGEKVND